MRWEGEREQRIELFGVWSERERERKNFLSRWWVSFVVGKPCVELQLTEARTQTHEPKKNKKGKPKK